MPQENSSTTQPAPSPAPQGWDQAVEDAAMQSSIFQKYRAKLAKDGYKVVDK